MCVVARLVLRVRFWVTQGGDEEVPTINGARRVIKCESGGVCDCKDLESRHQVNARGGWTAAHRRVYGEMFERRAGGAASLLREQAGFVLHGSLLRVLALMWPRSSITERGTERRTTPIKVSLRVHCALIGRRVYLALKLKRIPRASTHCSCICAEKNKKS